VTVAVEIAVRAHTQDPATPRGPGRLLRNKRRFDPARRPESILIVDCEVTDDAVQALLFACYRSYRVSWGEDGLALSCTAEGLAHDDDLEERDPGTYSQLQAYVQQERAATAPALLDASPRLQLLSRAEFVETVLLATLSAGGTVVSFGSTFELGRFGIGWGAARGPVFGGGFSLPLASYLDAEGRERENLFRPRLRWRAFDARRARIGLSASRPGSDPDVVVRRTSSAFLDLRTLAYSLTGNDHTLDSARATFPYNQS
jgi:hypothetical protein